MIDYENRLLSQLLERQYGISDINGILETCEKVEWAKGWPKNKEAFWNCEAFMWRCKVGKDERELIRKEIIKFIGVNYRLNLDIGSGSNSYIKSVAFDCSSKMLDFNDNAIEKINGDMEKKWPIVDNYFESLTAIFVLNYIKDLEFVFSEIKRVLIKKGKIVVVFSATGVSKMHQMHEKKKKNIEDWESLFKDNFKIKDSYIKRGMWFFMLLKR